MSGYGVLVGGGHRRVGLLVWIGVAALLTSPGAQAELEPDWISRLPAGASLSGGISDMVVDAAGVSYVTGIVGSSSNTDILTAAFSPEGALLWSDLYNGPEDWHDQARGIALDAQGHVYVVGNTPSPRRNANGLLLKYDAATGVLLNEVRYSSDPSMAEYLGSVVADADGNVYAGGGTGGDGSDTMLVKFDPAGEAQWVSKWDGPAWGPYSQDIFQKVALHPDGHPVAMIHGVMGSNHPDYVVIKYDAADGSVIWETNWGVNGGDSPVDMEIDAAGDVFVTGIGIIGNDRFSTIKLAGDNGRLLWQAYDGIAFHNGVAGLALDGRGDVYVTGSIDPDGDRSNFDDNFYSVKRDGETGDLLWVHQYGANCRGCFDVPADVVVDSGGHVLISGSTSSPPYSWETILFALDAETGNEVDRGTILPTPGVGASAGVMRFDRWENLYIGGGTYHADTGEREMTVARYPTMTGGGCTRDPAWVCDGDVDGDGQVNPVDSGLVQSAFGSVDSQDLCSYDVDCDGQINPVDAGIVQSLFGTCDPPRDVCP